MSSHAAAVSVAASPGAAHPALGKPTLALGLGVAGIALTFLGLFVAPSQAVASSWLLGMTFWTGIALGMLLLTMIHHIFDAGWSTVVRRQLEHGISVFPWLALLFLPLLITAWTHKGLIWSWMNPAAPLHGHGTVGEDILYIKKAAFLNLNMFTGMSVGFFASWIWLAFRLRKASFAQDRDGDPKWTRMNRVTAAFGIPIAAITLTFASIYWLKSLEYHWFSTMYGVWFFATSTRGALCITALVVLWLSRSGGPLNGILTRGHMHDIGKLMLAFTVFWAYVTFSQYFLIWNANVPEETFWYVEREYADWWYVGLALVFGYFLFSFLFLLSYRHKVQRNTLGFIASWNLVFMLLDLAYNILPFRKDDHGHPLHWLTAERIWDVTALVGIGGICVWAYLTSLSKTAIIPLRDPRILESVNHHE